MRNYNEYDIIIDPSQELSLDSLCDKLPPLGPISHSPLEFDKTPVTDVGLVAQWQLEQDFELGLVQDTPMLNHFYEDESVRQERKARANASQALNVKKREPVYLESQRTRGFSAQSEGQKVDGTAHGISQLNNNSPSASSSEQSGISEEQSKSNTTGGQANSDQKGKQVTTDAEQGWIEEGDSERREVKEHKSNRVDEHQVQETSHRVTTDKTTTSSPNNQTQTSNSNHTTLDIRHSCQNVHLIRNHILKAHCQSPDGTFVPATLDMNTIISFNGQTLQWGHGGGYLRSARRAKGDATGIHVQCRVGRRWQTLSLTDVHEHVVNQGGRLVFCLEPWAWGD